MPDLDIDTLTAERDQAQADADRWAALYREHEDQHRAEAGRLVADIEACRQALADKAAAEGTTSARAARLRTALDNMRHLAECGSPDLAAAVLAKAIRDDDRTDADR